MLTVVAPCATRSSAVVSARSVSGSTALVASSSTSSPGAAMCARTSATSWRSPTDRPSPRSPTTVSSPSGQALQPVVEAELRERVLDLVDRSRRAGRPRTFSRMRRVEQEAVLGHEADRPAALVAGDDPQVLAADLDAAAGRDRRAGTGATRTSSCPIRSRRRSRRSCRPGSTTLTSMSTGGPVAVGEVDVVGDDRQRAGGQVRRRSGRRARRSGCRAPRAPCANPRPRSGSGR